MEVAITHVIWEEASIRVANGSFEDDYFEAVEDDTATWLEESEFDDVLSVVFWIGSAMDSITPHCSTANQEAISNSYGKFMTEESDQWNEFSGTLDPETYWLALSPGTVKDLSASLSRIDYAEIKQLYGSHCPDDVREVLAYSADEFIEHLQSWGNEIESAAKKDKGLVVSVG